MGLRPDDPAERCRLADRAAGVGAERPRRQAAGDGGRRAARGATRHPVAVPGVANRPVAGVLVRRAHRELVHVGLAEQAGAGFAEAPHRGGRVRRPVALEDPRAGGGLDPLGAEQVLDRERGAAQGVAAGAARAGLGSPQVGVELVAGGRLGVGVEVLVGGDLPRLDPPDRGRGAELDQLSRIGAGLAHACGEGTRKAPSAGSGAFSSARSRGRLGSGVVGSQDVLELDHVGRRLDAVEVERGDRVDVLEDPEQLLGHPLDLVLGELEPREPGDVQDLLAIDHRANVRAGARAGTRQHADGHPEGRPSCSPLLPSRDSGYSPIRSGSGRRGRRWRRVVAADAVRLVTERGALLLHPQ